MELRKVSDRVSDRLQSLKLTTAKKFGAVLMLATAVMNGQAFSTAGADVPKMRVSEVCASPGHNYVEVNAFNDRDTTLTVKASARNKLGELVTEDTLTIPAHKSDGQNFNAGAIEGGNIVYTEPGVPGSVFVDENVCGPKSATTTTLASTTTTTRVLASTTTTLSSPSTTTTRLPASTTTVVSSVTTTPGGGLETGLPQGSTGDTYVAETSPTTIAQSPVAQASTGRLLALTG